MAIANTRILTFDTGIERIIQSGERADQPLPERNALTPTGEPVRVRLDEMLRGSVRPQISDKTVLAPGRYQTLLDEAQAELRRRAGGESNALANAAALLEEEQQLRDLLNTLRNLLVQG